MEDLKTENETLVSNTYLNVEQVQGNNTQQGLYAISVPINKVKNSKYLNNKQGNLTCSSCAPRQFITNAL